MKKTLFSSRIPAYWAALLLALVSLNACRALSPTGVLSISSRSTATSTPFQPAGTFTPTPEALLADTLQGSQTSPLKSETAAPTHSAGAEDGLTPSPTSTGTMSADADSGTSTPTAGPTESQPPTETSPPQPTKTAAPSATALKNTPPPTTDDRPPPAASPSAPPSASPAPTDTPAPTAAAPPDTPPPAGCSFSGNAGFENQVVNLINQERADRGLPALSQNASLRSAARGHSQDMACNDHFSHTGFNGSTLASRLSAAGYSYSWAAENIAAGHSQGFSPGQVVDLWMGSAGHRKNILSEKARHIGVGFRYVDGGSSSLDAYYTADFGRP